MTFQVFGFFKSKTCSIEMVRDNHLLRVHFYDKFVTLHDNMPIEQNSALSMRRPSQFLT